MSKPHAHIASSICHRAAAAAQYLETGFFFYFFVATKTKRKHETQQTHENISMNIYYYTITPIIGHSKIWSSSSTQDPLRILLYIDSNAPFLIITKRRKKRNDVLFSQHNVKFKILNFYD